MWRITLGLPVNKSKQLELKRLKRITTIQAVTNSERGQEIRDGLRKAREQVPKEAGIGC